MGKLPITAKANQPGGVGDAVPPQASGNAKSGPHTLSPEEKIAQDAIIKVMPEAKKLRITGSVEQFLGGILYIVAFVDEDGDDNEVEVFVRNNRPTIYWSSEDLAKFVAMSREPIHLLDRISSSDFVISILSFIIVISAFAAFFFFGSNKDALSWVQAPMSIVLGFWFGRGYQRQGTRSPDV